MTEHNRKTRWGGRATASRRTVLGMLGASLIGTPAVAKSADDETTYKATVLPPAEDQSFDSDVYCSADPAPLNAIDRSEGDQVRVRRSEDEYALYTVSETRDELPDNFVRMAESGRERLGTTDNEFGAVVDATVPHPNMTAESALRNGEFIERLNDPGSESFVISVPHGGQIEPFTDVQGARLHSQRNEETTFWYCRGWNNDGSAFERWHIPTYDISPASFPKLGSIANRGFERGVSIQGIGTDDVRIAGNAPESMKEEVVDNIAAVLPEEIPVQIATDTYELEEDSLINRLVESEETFWIGQSFDARRNYWQEIADALTKTFQEL